MSLIMKLENRPKLALLVSVLLILACGTIFNDGSAFGPGCNSYANVNSDHFVRTLGYTCPFTCPDGTFLTGERKENDDETYTELKDRTLKSCPEPGPTLMPLPQQQPNIVPVPSATPTPVPYLSGEVSACDLGDGFINFTLDPKVTVTANTAFDVTLGGQAIQCTVPASNTKVLSCSLPHSQTFPVEVNLSVNGSLTDTFTYDGANCTRPGSPHDGPAQQPGGEPTCTGLPPYPEGCTPP